MTRVDTRLLKTRLRAHAENLARRKADAKGAQFTGSLNYTVEADRITVAFDVIVNGEVHTWTASEAL